MKRIILILSFIFLTGLYSYGSADDLHTEIVRQRSRLWSEVAKFELDSRDEAEKTMLLAKAEEELEEDLQEQIAEQAIEQEDQNELDPVEASAEEAESDMFEEKTPVVEEESMEESVLEENNHGVFFSNNIEEKTDREAEDLSQVEPEAEPVDSVEELAEEAVEEPVEVIEEVAKVNEPAEEIQAPIVDEQESPVVIEEAVSEVIESENEMTESLGIEQGSADEEETYWELPLKDQTILDIEYHQTIDESYKEAKSIKLPVAKVKKEEVKEAPMIMTDSHIIRSIIKEDLHEKKIDFDLDETSIVDILMTIGATGEFNVVLDPSLKGNTLDLHLNQVTLEEALLLIANSFNLGFKRVGDTLYITSREKIRSQNLTSKVIKLRNIKVEEAKSLIEELVQSVSTSEEINSLIVVGEPEEIIKVEEIIAQIDTAQPQIVLEAKIIEVNKDALKDVGVDWSDSITLSNQESGRPVDFSNNEDSPGSPMEIFSFSRNPIQFNAIIKMLENQNKAKVLSNPRITTLNDKEAEIFVGDRIPYEIQNIAGGVITTEVQWVEPGIRLTITPSIIEDDFVVIKVEPEVSFIFAFRGPNDDYPQIKTREATAYVRIKNNEPFVLGGLLNQEDKNSMYKVPVLGNVPLLGNLFKYNNHTLIDTELIITIIPRIVRGDL